MKKKSDIVTLIVLIILIMALIGSLGYIIVNGDSNGQTNTVNNVKQNTLKNNNETKNNTEKENVTKNNIENNSTENNNIENTTKNTSNVEKNEKKEEKKAKNTEEERRKFAENLVKSKWGSEDGVYFSADGMDSAGKYIVNIRDSNTTAVYATYIVDADTEVVSEY